MSAWAGPRARRACAVGLAALLPAACSAKPPDTSPPPASSRSSGLERLLDPLRGDLPDEPRPWPCVVMPVEPCPVDPQATADTNAELCVATPASPCPSHEP